MQIGDKVYYYRIELDVNGKVKKEKEENKTLGINDKYLCLDDRIFTTLQLESNKSYNIYSVFDIPKVYENKWNCRSLTDNINGYLYTAEADETKAYKRIKKEIERYLKKEYGKYGNYIQLLDKIEI